MGEKTRARKAVRIADIAKKAGVSPGVVSSFFNGRMYGEDTSSVIGVGEETRKRILSTCRDLDYRPADPVLRAKIYPEETDVVFLLNESIAEGIENNFFSLILSGIEKAASTAGVKVSFTCFSPTADYLSSPNLLPPVVQEGATFKFILGGEVNYSLVLALKQRGCAVAYLNRLLDIEGVVSVVPDYYRAASTAIENLYALGHRRIRVVAEAYFNPSSYNCRELIRGCSAGFAKCGLPFSEEDICFKATPGPEPGHSSAHTVYQAAREHGLRIPEDLSVFGCNDDRSARYMTPPLSTIHLPTRRIGAHAFEEVSKMAAGKPASASPIILPVEPVLRESLAKIESGK